MQNNSSSAGNTSFQNSASASQVAGSTRSRGNKFVPSRQRNASQIAGNGAGSEQDRNYNETANNTAVDHSKDHRKYD